MIELSIFFAVIQVVGVNRTVDESEGSVEVCFMMDNEADIPISIELTFTKNIDPSMTPAQGIFHMQCLLTLQYSALTLSTLSCFT